MNTNCTCGGIAIKRSLLEQQIKFGMIVFECQNCHKISIKRTPLYIPKEYPTVSETKIRMQKRNLAILENAQEVLTLIRQYSHNSKEFQSLLYNTNDL